MTTLLLFMVADANRRGYRHLLDAFWDEARSHRLELPTDEPVSAASFCAARQKISPDLLRHLIHTIASTSAETAFENQRWHGKRVFAVDGTKINLQRSPELEVAYGVPNGAYCPQVLTSIMLDVCAKTPVDVQVSGYASSERDHLFDMLPNLDVGDVLVLDRGYPSHKVLQALVQQRIDFLIRVPSTHTFTVVDELRESEGSDYLFYVDPPNGSPPEWKQLSLRLVKIKAPDGSESFFMTTLRRAKFSRPQLSELYHLRWEAEEFFKLLKGPYVGQGQFRSRSALGIEQEIHALVLFLQIARLLMATAADVTETDYRALSQKSAALGLAAYVSRLFLPVNQDYRIDELDALLQRIVRTRDKPRPGRSAPRRSFRPRLRWGPSGRCGA